jgi:CBS domain containing-hemolysin-like protein
MFWLDLFKLSAVAALVLANGFFVAAEFCLVSVRRTRIEELAAQGNTGARLVQEATLKPDRFIAATQLGITLASLGLGWIGEPFLAHLIEPAFDFLFRGWGTAASHAAAAGTLTFILITFLLVVVGELMPKSISLQRPEQTALVVAGPILLTERLFRPVILALNGAGNLLLRAVGFEPASGQQMVHSVEEIKLLVDDSQEGGVLEMGEREMLHGVLDFGDMQANQVMIPRTEMICVDAEAPIEEVIQTAATHPLTKFPVYERDLDHIIGILHTRDLVRVVHREGRRSSTSLRRLVREALYVPETIHASDLLVRFRARKQHMAIVLDEYGGTAGLVTLSDLIEEIVGQVLDVFDRHGPDIERLADGSALINGLTVIEEVNDTFGLGLSDPNYETIAGYILGRLGRVAQVGDEVDAGNVRLRVETMDGLRIARVKLARRQQQVTPDEARPAAKNVTG